MNREHAHEFTEALGQVLGGAVRLAEWAPEVGIPEALGLTPQEWAERRLAGAVKLSIPERRAVAPALIERGLTQREAAEVLGVGLGTINRDLHAVPDGTPGPENPALEPEPEPSTVPDGTPEPEPDSESPPEPEPESEGRDRTVLFTSTTDDWSTPQHLFDRLDAEFGFQLDVCATSENAKCEWFYSPEDDGLTQAWGGACWMNPPYGEHIGRWVAKAYESAQAGATVACLVPARVDTAWFWNYCRHGEVRFLRGRLRFGGADTSAPFPSAVVVFGPDYPASVQWWEDWS